MKHKEKPFDTKSALKEKKNTKKKVNLLKKLFIKKNPAYKTM